MENVRATFHRSNNCMVVTWLAVDAGSCGAVYEMERSRMVNGSVVEVIIERTTQRRTPTGDAKFICNTKEPSPNYRLF